MSSPQRRPLAVRVLIVLGGFGLVVVGGLLLVLPGPGLLLIAAGLGMLSLEFRWAARLRASVVRRMARVTPQKRAHRIAVVAAMLALAVAGTLIVALVGRPGFWPG